MTGYNKVFLDTTPLIYFLDSDINFGEKTKLILEEVISEGKEIFTSAITCMEYMVYPYRTGNQDKIDAFFEFTGDCGIPIKAVDVDLFLTNDNQLRQFKQLRCVTVEEWELKE